MKKLKFYILVFSVLAVSCTEPYPLDSEGNLEELLVVEAAITNKMKKQEIKISRVFELGTENYNPETGAEVYVQDDLGNIFDFEFNVEEGLYSSVMPFQALPERTYQLFIISEGTEYQSTPQILPAQTELDNIVVVQKTVDGVEGLEIQANSYDPTGASNYYRYEYEGTYKIIAEYWSPYKAVWEYLPLPPYNIISYIMTDEYKRVCYGYRYSEKIIQKSTIDQVEDRVQDFPIVFIPKNNGMLAHRYSILVKQYVENLEAFTFYRTLKNLSQSGDILSPVQPGFINGNISAIGNEEEKVVGLFHLTSESSKRLFFSYGDFFPGDLPELVECEVEVVTSPYVLANYINNNTMILYMPGENINEYVMVTPECGDCAIIGSPETPEYWEE